MSQITTLYVNCDDLCQAANISREQIFELVQFDILAPTTGSLPQDWQFEGTALILANKALRIHRDLTLDWADVALVMRLMEEISTLKEENLRLKQRLNRFLMDEI